jgi:predicted amidohydrolase
MKVVCCQFNVAWEDKFANYAKVRSMLESSKITTGSLVVLPEMFSTGFSMNVPGIREGSPSQTESFLSACAQDHEIFVLAGLVTAASDGRGRNEAVVFTPKGTLLSRYSKIYPFTFGGESDHYVAGTEVVSFLWHEFVVAPFICYDLRFPEVFRKATIRGAHLFVIIANWAAKRENHWVTLLRARAIENQAYVVGVNRCGNDPKIAYSGRSLIVDPLGEILADAGDKDCLVSAEIELPKVMVWRNEFPALKDMRQEYLNGKVERSAT